MPAPRTLTRFAITCAIAALAACGQSGDTTTAASDGPPGNPGEGGTRAVFVVPSSLDALAGPTFFDHPWPSDLRRAEGGAVRFAGWPNPSAVPLIDELVAATSGLLHGFSPTAATYLRFTGPLDPSTLPSDPPATLARDAGVQVVDVDPSSPEHGTRRMVQLQWRETVADASFFSTNTLAILPLLGRPLRPHTTYAAVVTRRVRAAGGGELGRTDALEEVLGRAPVTSAHRAVVDLFAPAVRELAAAGVAPADVAHLTVFTTDDPTAETFAVADDVTKSVPAPTARDWVAKDDTADLDVYEGTYGPSPNYQIGNVPYRTKADGGGFVFENGKPKLAGTFDLRFALAVPKAAQCPPPASGYPVVIYAHGTGGDYRSFVSDGTARSLAGQCLASIGIDQIFHGTRPGAPPESDPAREGTISFLFFNFDNALAGRTNNRQAAIDVVQEARLFTETKATVPATVSRTGAAIAFDPAKVTFFGHSQGGLNGPLFLAATDAARGAVLSGAGSVLGVALLEKTQPIDITRLVRMLVCGSSSDCADELSVFHPGIALAQSIVDAADPVHYASFITSSPRPGLGPKSIYQTEGVNPDGTGDSYAPPKGIEALSVALGLPRVAPGIHARPDAMWLGLSDVAPPVGGFSGNLGGGRATGVLAQFAPRPGHDGHFVVFDDPTARLESAKFLRAASDEAIGHFTP